MPPKLVHFLYRDVCSIQYCYYIHDVTRNDAVMKDATFCGLVIKKRKKQHQAYSSRFIRTLQIDSPS